MIYLSSPYSHRDPYVREKRFRAAKGGLVWLLRSGRHAFSPIVYNHQLHINLPNWEAKDWLEYDEKFLAMCTEIMFLEIDGRDESSGCYQEHTWAQARNWSVTALCIDPQGAYYIDREFVPSWKP